MVSDICPWPTFPSTVALLTYDDVFCSKVVGDVAILNSLPEGDEEAQRKVGEYIMSRNKAIKVYSTGIFLCLFNVVLMQCRECNPTHEQLFNPHNIQNDERYVLHERIHCRLPFARLALMVWFNWRAQSDSQSLLLKSNTA